LEKQKLINDIETKHAYDVQYLNHEIRQLRKENEYLEEIKQVESQAL